MKSKMLTLAIVIPVFNEENYLKRCLDAIASQTVLPQEVFVVDNNSTDSSIELVKQYSFVTVLTEKRQGIVYARNLGFNTATTDLIGRIDADTVLDESWVETVLRLASLEPEVAAFTGPCAFRAHFGHTFWFYLHRLIYFWSSRLLFGHTILFGSNMFIRGTAWDAVKMNACIDDTIHEDMDLAYHLSVLGYKIRFTPDLKAVISIRRFKHGWHYPKMWLKTKFIH